MKNSQSLMMGTALTALLAGSAVAADMPLKGRAYTAPAPAFSWTGCYIGAHVGGGVLHDSGDGALLLPTNSWAERGNGALAGGQLGCNYQTGMLVFGIEGDGFWSGMKSTNNDPVFPEVFTTKNKYDFDITARLGVAFDRTYIYGKAGWVWGEFDFNTQAFGTVTEDGSAALNGLLIGAGVEYALINNWTAKIEYNYLKYRSQDVVITQISIPTGATILTESRSADKQIIKLGLNYKLY